MNGKSNPILTPLFRLRLISPLAATLITFQRIFSASSICCSFGKQLPISHMHYPTPVSPFSPRMYIQTRSPPPSQSQACGKELIPQTHHCVIVSGKKQAKRMASGEEISHMAQPGSANRRGHPRIRTPRRARSFAPTRKQICNLSLC